MIEVVERRRVKRRKKRRRGMGMGRTKGRKRGLIQVGVISSSLCASL